MHGHPRWLMDYYATCGIVFMPRINITGPNQTWEIGGLAGKQGGMWENGRKKITMEYEKLLSVICFVNEFPKTKQRKYPQYTAE